MPFFDNEFFAPYKKQYSLKRVEANGKRQYQISYNGEKFSLPSVTTFLSETKSAKSKAILDNWKKRVGEKQAAQITKKSADRGTKLHTLVEDYIKTNKFPTDYKLKKLKNIIDTRLEKVILIEEYLFSKKVGLAGTVDCIGYFDGKLSVIDWKTSIKEKKEEWIEDYFLQATIYALMFGDLTGHKISQIVLVIQLDNSILPQVFVRSPKDYIDRIKLRLQEYKQKVN